MNVESNFHLKIIVFGIFAVGRLQIRQQTYMELTLQKKKMAHSVTKKFW